jgi:hypothetical protein
LAPDPECDALFRAVITAGGELGELTPELADCRPLAFGSSLPSGLVGAYVPVTSREAAFYVGIVSDICSCGSLARIWERVRADFQLGVRAALLDLAHELGRRFVRHTEPALSLVPGRPIFIDGVARHRRPARLRAAEVAFGHVHATLTMTSWDALRETDWPGRDSAAGRSKRQP